jgi:hypothetical protein
MLVTLRTLSERSLGKSLIAIFLNFENISTLGVFLQYFRSTSSAYVELDQSQPLLHLAKPGKIHHQFTFYTTVTWVQEGNIDTKILRPRPPIMIMSLPENFFYPFSMSSCHTNVSQRSFILLMLTATSFLVKLVLL